MELTAVLKLLESHPDRSLKIQADSTYVLNIFTDVVNGLRRKGPRTSKGTHLKNFDLIEQIDALLEERELKNEERELKNDVHWEWVRGHTGHPLNESADRLAGFARSQARLGFLC